MVDTLRNIGGFALRYTKLESGECPVENYWKMCSGDALFQASFREDASDNVYVDINPADHDGDEYMMAPPLAFCSNTPQKITGFWERQIGGRTLYVRSKSGWEPATSGNMPPLRDAAGSDKVAYFDVDNEFRQCLRDFTGVSDSGDTAMSHFLALTYYINLSNAF